MESIHPAPSPAESGTVCILDDDEDVLRFLLLATQPLNLDVRGYQNSHELLNAQLISPACLIVDWQLKGIDGLEVIAQCQARWPLTPMILISGKATVPVAVNAMRQGVIGVLEKPVRPEDLRREILAALELARQRISADIRQNEAQARVKELTENERTVLQMIVQGVPNKKIAVQMNLSMRTIEKYRSALFSKLGVDSAAEATQVWFLSNLKTEPRI